LQEKIGGIHDFMKFLRKAWNQGRPLFVLFVPGCRQHLGRSPAILAEPHFAMYRNMNWCTRSRLSINEGGFDILCIRFGGFNWIRSRCWCAVRRLPAACGIGKSGSVPGGGL